jgi:hypothetical protein
VRWNEYQFEKVFEGSYKEGNGVYEVGSKKIVVVDVKPLNGLHDGIHT